MLTWKSLNLKLLLPVLNRWAGLEVFSDEDVLWKLLDCWRSMSFLSWYQRWEEMSKHLNRSPCSTKKVRIDPLVLPVLLSGTAEGNCAHGYIGKVCCSLHQAAPQPWHRTGLGIAQPDMLWIFWFSCSCSIVGPKRRIHAIWNACYLSMWLKTKSYLFQGCPTPKIYIGPYSLSSCLLKFSKNKR